MHHWVSVTLYEMEEGTTYTDEVCAIIVSGELDREAVVRLISHDGTALGKCG